MSESNYIYDVYKNVLVINDLDLGNMSVTNNVQKVLDEISERIDLPQRVIYRDTSKIYDGIEHVNGKFKRFYPIQTENIFEAIEKVLEEIKEA